MATLRTDEIFELIAEFYGGADEALLGKLSDYLDLLVKWNARTNLTAIRVPREMVRRHFGESLFAARSVPLGARTLLDYGSGGGFPGLPIALARPELAVTLAESQGKKVAFLREAVRVLGVSCDVWAGRVEGMPSGRSFDVVTMRAVDKPGEARVGALERVRAGGILMSLEGAEGNRDGAEAADEVIWLPGGVRRCLRMTRLTG